MRTLLQVARYINAKDSLQLCACIDPSFTSTDRKDSGGRRIPGKGRRGMRLRVYFGEELVHDKDTSIPYRTVKETLLWLANWEAGNRYNDVQFGSPRPTGEPPKGTQR